jgi:hypothetical protein
VTPTPRTGDPSRADRKVRRPDSRKDRRTHPARRIVHTDGLVTRLARRHAADTERAALAITRSTGVVRVIAEPTHTSADD